VSQWKLVVSHQSGHTRTDHEFLLAHTQTTMTEKLLLFGGAIHQAGEVKARR